MIEESNPSGTNMSRWRVDKVKIKVTTKNKYIIKFRSHQFGWQSGVPQGFVVGFIFLFSIHIDD